MILKSDQEPSIKELLRAVKRERAEDIEVLMEESPVGEHASEWCSGEGNPRRASSDQNYATGGARSV